MARKPSIILCADDDEDAQLLLQRAFRQAQSAATLKQVGDGREAMEYLEGRGAFADRTEYPYPDLLLLDLKMPEASGFDVLTYLRGRMNRPRVVVFSSSNDPSDLAKARELGSDDYVVKPREFSALVELVRKWNQEIMNGSHGETRGEAPPERQVRRGKLNPEESPNLFGLLVDQVKDYAIFLLDPDGVICSWNEGARRIKGYTSAEAIGKHFSDFYPPQDIDLEKPRFELRMAREMGRYEDEGWRIRKDGSRFWANVVITPLYGAEGKLTGFAKVTRDLTQRKLQEESLQRVLQSEERFRLLVDQIKDYAIFFLDARGYISSWNQGGRKIKGYTADEIIGRHFSIFYTQEDLAAEKPARELSIATREGRYEEEGWRLKKDGSRFWASVLITSLWDKNGNLTAFAKVTRDLTEKKREEEAIRHKNEELEAFAHTLSHDLRAPLRSISGFAQILKDDLGKITLEEQKVYLDRIFKSAQTMDALIQDILRLSEMSLTPGVKEPVAIESVIREALDLLEAEISRTGADIQVARDLPVVSVDRILLLQIFSNLITNALKFVRPGLRPAIQIFFTARGELCQIHVKDAGTGIPAEHHTSIFKIFQRGVATPGSMGTGVGLAIVKRALERAGGNITLVSKEGEGSDFIVTLPCESGAVPAGNRTE